MRVEASKRLRVKASTKATASTPQPFNPSTIIVFNRQRKQVINLRLLKQIAHDLLAELKIWNGRLEINLVNAQKMKRLNETFLRHMGSTDVITFDYAAPTTGTRASRPRDLKGGTRGRAARAPLFGEIFICVDEAVVQAKKFRTSWQMEIARYLIHGVLHLLGHDDLRAASRRKMKREENHLLRKYSRRFWLAQLASATKLSACTNR